jgi:hypothetical protein
MTSAFSDHDKPTLTLIATDEIVTTRLCMSPLKKKEVRVRNRSVTTSSARRPRALHLTALSKYLTVR